MTIDLDALEALCAAASPGPWELREGARGFDVIGADERYITGNFGTEEEMADGAFIAASRDALPALCQRVRELESKLTQLHMELREREDLYSQIHDEHVDKEMAWEEDREKLRAAVRAAVAKGKTS